MTTTRLPQLIDTVLARYGDAPALIDPPTGTVEPRTVTYAQLRGRTRALSTAWRTDVEPGHFLAELGFTSADYVTVDLAATEAGLITVPLQSGAPLSQLRAIVRETEPTVFAVSAAHSATAAALSPDLGSVRRVVVFDTAATPDAGGHIARLRAAFGDAVTVAALAEELAYGQSLPPAAPHAPTEDDPLISLIYTSGSTGTPKGAMYTEAVAARAWHLDGPQFVPAEHGATGSLLHHLPMSHMYGRNVVFLGLAAGGVGHFASSPDMSTLFDDYAAARPTALTLVPRICELIAQRYYTGIDALRRTDPASDAAATTSRVRRELRENLFGGRVAAISCGSAPLAPDLRSLIEAIFEVPVRNGYGSTEAGGVLLDGVIQRPPVRAYRLVDVPELGYLATDLPYPRGELQLQSDSLIPGYYRRPEANAELFTPDGFYRTGDVLAELGPDRLEYVDRRSNVIKLSQGEFVPVAQLEAAFEAAPELRQVFLYGDSSRSYLVGVVVPANPAHTRRDLTAALARVGAARELAPYELPREILIETEPFTRENGLLTGIGKLARPALTRRYRDRLQALYTDAAQRARAESAGLDPGAGTLVTVRRAAALTLGLAPADLDDGAGFADLGGDSLSALTLANTLEGVFSVAVPVQVIVGPTATVAGIAEYLEQARAADLRGDAGRPSAASVHGAGSAVARAADLRLADFVDPELLAAAPDLPAAAAEAHMVLLTGATGYLGRFLCLEWLERLAPMGGTVVALIRGRDAKEARRRLDAAVGTADPALATRFAELADAHLEVIPADLAQPRLGLTEDRWADLARRVELIVHSGALVNHVLPYSQLFAANTSATAELIALAVSTTRKPLRFVSTVAVAARPDGSLIGEDADIRVASAQRATGTGYAAGYASSKWAAEVLLRQGAELGIPVTVFRSDMILAHHRYTGQFNPTDMFTRLLFSVIRTGLAPASFHLPAAEGRRAHYDGLPVDFTAAAICAIGAGEGHRTFNVLNTNDDGISLDTFMRWLADDGVALTFIADYDEWFTRFVEAMELLPEADRRHSMLPLLDSLRRPAPVPAVDAAPTHRFRAAVRTAGVCGGALPSLDHALITAYREGFAVTGWLAPGRVNA